METVNKISEGVHLDNNEYDQPNNSMRDSRNGIIYDLVSGNYVWKNLKGTLEVLELAANDVIMKACRIRDRQFFFVLNTTDDYFQLRELLFATDGTISSTAVRWQTTNTIMGMSLSHPIRAMFGVYENVDIQRIYWSDYYNHPRCINIGSYNLVTPNEKFIDFTPVIDNAYGMIEFTSELAGGSLKAGNYFFAWRLYKEGYYTDWSYVSAPIPVFNGSVGSNYSDYQAIEGAAPDENTGKGMRLTLSLIDSDYEKIQVASFYCNDLNSVAEGKIIYESVLTSTSIVIDYSGSENAGTVTVAELMSTSILIEKCFDMMHLQKRNIMANIEERSELDFSNLTGGKNGQIQVSIIPSQYAILLDTTPYGYHVGLPYVKELSGTKTATLELNAYKLISYAYHFAVTEVKYYIAFTEAEVTVPAGEYFRTPLLSTLTPHTGTAKLAIVKRKYRKASGSLPYNLGTDYVLDASTVENNYYNYKNPKFTEKLLGYPGGEKIRLGILFLDKTGRPFFVRHLYNTETDLSGMTIGPGDTRIPNRGENGGNFPISIVDKYESSVPTYYKNTLGFINYLTVSGIDISSVKDDIGAFMIVRCPIERENIGYGFLGMTNAIGNDIFANKTFRAESNDSAHYPGAYTFYSPESHFNFKDFSIQPGDKIVNRYYVAPFYPEGTPVTGGGSAITGFQGYGVSMDPGNGAQYNFYQKFYIHDNVVIPSGNGAIEAEHEVIAYTKYTQGDGDSISIDPRDETKELRYGMMLVGGGGNCYTYLCNLGVVVLDIDEGAGPAYDVKGIFDLPEDYPLMLICTVKRPNANPYGGLGDAALASSVYQSTGHYQIIDSAVLADIKVADTYIFNEIDIFGGDTFVCIWDIIRNMQNKDLDGTVSRYSHSVLVPIETRINLDLREGDHVSKLRCYSTGGLESGLKWMTGSNKWEEFNYNDGYSSDTPNRLYLPLPNNFSFENVFDTRFRYSPEKSYGEYEDKYRRFNAFDHFTIETAFGPIVNIRGKNNNIVYWQKNGVGYIPMGERALTSNNFGNAVQLGVGGIFERYDNLLEFIGNSNQFGLVESDLGFLWYDAVRKLVITLDNSFKFTQESIVKGLDSFIVNQIPNNMDQYDNPITSHGIVGGYDPRDKMVYLTFRSASLNETIGISIKSNKFSGFFDFRSRVYFNFRDYLYSVDDSFNTVFQHGTGVIGSYHGITKDRYLTIIVKENSDIAKIFDHYQIIGNNKFFTTADFTLEDGSTVKEYFSGANSFHLADRLEYRNKRWFGSYPKISRERLVGGYVKITFTDSGSDALEFLQMKTTFREMI